MIVKPATLTGWHRNALRLFGRWKSRPFGRPRVPADVKELIRPLAGENPNRGEQRIVEELLPKLQIRLSPRTVAQYSKQSPRLRGARDQHWSTFPKNHANAISSFAISYRCDGWLFAWTIQQIWDGKAPNCRIGALGSAGTKHGKGEPLAVFALWCAVFTSRSALRQVIIAKYFSRLKFNCP